MRKLVLFVPLMLLSLFVFSQTTSTKKKWDLSRRTGDHFVIQLISDQWLGVPDSIRYHINPISRGFAAYVMLDNVFKGNPQFSIAGGVGVNCSGVYLDRMSADLAGTTPRLKFHNLDTSNHFSKYKIATTYAEIPVEIRFCYNPENPAKSFKAAIGIKVGTIINAHTKGKNWSDASGKTINGYTEKTTNRNYFNGNRLSATARFGFGNFTIFGSYGISSVFKDNVAADMHLLQLGLQLSGL